MRPSALNRICAHPMIVSWVCGASVLNTTVIVLLLNDVSLSSVFADWPTALSTLIVLTLTSMLGFFLGMFTCWPLIRRACCRFNGAPLKIGDQVMILSGPHKGEMTDVYAITIGQGGWNLARLKLGQECEVIVSNRLQITSGKILLWLKILKERSRR